ncbi:hypothetical protein O4H49_19505 [Kiloniella laminariae]|uniref:DUF4145 domain-containing protein n=1 Tax=Kiloniella laminariae TaxID=454162 RepID=A0ABT4LPD1_9PROT|nr:hypothetical protein [Kiloniella laminariae]MCZ4282979.1 hypothetical protein [Kiloniella laminariae]
MDQLELPRDVIWSERRFWFEELEAKYSVSGSPSPGEQACALMIDLQAVFCTGAWAATVILASSIIQAQIKECGGHLDWIEPDDLSWINKLRNRLVHGDKRKPGLTIQDQWLKRPEWEAYARKSVEVTFRALYR